MGQKRPSQAVLFCSGQQLTAAGRHYRTWSLHRGHELGETDVKLEIPAAARWLCGHREAAGRQNGAEPGPYSHSIAVVKCSQAKTG
jgi:hypothetical protein